MTEPTVLQQAYRQLREINTKDRRKVMVEERDQAEIRKSSLSIDMSNIRADIEGLEALAAELRRAIETKHRLFEETLATYESVTKTAADLDVQIKRLEA